MFRFLFSALLFSVCPFVLFILDIVIFVLMASDYLFNSFKLFLVHEKITILV